ncbi:hypothetical protein Anas_04850 [Armadillidium nasatum]|uniref:Uncharacterized protein n=1 Tax=Armadillidium nasatum TaxID=96803 RepID=A0A5N5T0Z8_9CRUS|nr:hypothetical protein Anas_04850 [Armadillidium nasatum]
MIFITTLLKYFVSDRKFLEAHKCVTTITSECEDPTPSNILDSLITQAPKSQHPAHRRRRL